MGASCGNPSLVAVTEKLSGLDVVVRERVALLREQGSFFWLDVSLSETSRDDLVDALRVSERVFPALSLSGDASASRSFYADGESVVFAIRGYVETGVPPDEAGYGSRPVEVRVLVTGDYLLTLHEERVAAGSPRARPAGGTKQAIRRLRGARGDARDHLRRAGGDRAKAGRRRPGVGREERRARTVEGEAARDRPEALDNAARGQRQQAVFARIGVEIGALRGFETHDEPYFDRLYEQVNRLLASIDAAVSAMAMLLDLQLNERAYVVSVVATIFLPLTLITGFFGMNFGWMVDQIETPIAFWLLGFLGPIAVVVLRWRLLVRRFLIGD